MTRLFTLHSAHVPQCTARVDKYFDGYFTLQYMTRGGIFLQYDEEKYQLRGPWFWPCWPGPLTRFHLLENEASWEHRYIAFRGPAVSQWQEAGLIPFKPQQPKDPATCAELFDQLLAMRDRNDHFGHLRCINLIESLLLRLADERHDIQTPWIDQVNAKLAEQRTLWPNYEQLAESLGMGLSTLRRRYRDTAGISLHNVVLQQRIAAARQLLTETTLPLKEIARRLEYRDVYFFSRQFREVAGATPAAYRRSRDA